MNATLRIDYYQNIRGRVLRLDAALNHYGIASLRFSLSRDIDVE